MEHYTQRDLRRIVVALGVALLSAVGFMLLGMFIDIQVTLKYDYTPISFTFTFLLCGILVGVLLALKIVSHGTQKPVNGT